MKSYIIDSKSYRRMDGNKIIVSWRSICGSRGSKFDGKKYREICIIRFFILNLSVDEKDLIIERTAWCVKKSWWVWITPKSWKDHSIIKKRYRVTKRNRRIILSKIDRIEHVEIRNMKVMCTGRSDVLVMQETDVWFGRIEDRRREDEGYIEECYQQEWV